MELLPVAAALQSRRRQPCLLLQRSAILPHLGAERRDRRRRPRGAAHPPGGRCRDAIAPRRELRRRSRYRPPDVPDARRRRGPQPRDLSVRHLDRQRPAGGVDGGLCRDRAGACGARHLRRPLQEREPRRRQDRDLLPSLCRKWTAADRDRLCLLQGPGGPYERVPGADPAGDREPPRGAALGRPLEGPAGHCPERPAGEPARRPPRPRRRLLHRRRRRCARLRRAIRLAGARAPARVGCGPDRRPSIGAVHAGTGDRYRHRRSGEPDRRRARRLPARRPRHADAMSRRPIPFPLGTSMRRGCRGPTLIAALGAAMLAGLSPAMAQAGSDAGSPLPEKLRGPFIARPDVVQRLDHLDPGGDCDKSGKLVFACLIQALAKKSEQEAPAGPLSNPFNLRVAGDIAKTIAADLAELDDGGEDGNRTALNAKFFTHPLSRIELVGIVNRIDRQFIKDLVPGAEDHDRCGEISVIYRFSYSLHAGDVQSRLPVTMNVVFPAVPRDKPAGASNCREVAARWVAELARPADRSAEQVVADLTDPASGVLAPLTGTDIERLELNMQAYRIKAGSCEPGKSKPMSKADFQAYLARPEVLSDIDNGTLNIEQKYLACRATTVSPGGPHRSKNQPFWNAPTAALSIISDAQITAAVNAALSPTRQFSFMKSADDVRTRLNELACSGCHQARAIAGFHFPGADRADTAASNAVLLPGSPHFFGDQPRRLKILHRLAAGETLVRNDLAASYAARPLNKLQAELEGTELIGGWGGACLMEPTLTQSQRKWTCRAGLACTPLFKSANAPGLGTCAPKPDGPAGDAACLSRTGRQIGDAMQCGTVTTKAHGVDRYLRTDPPRETPPEWTDRAKRKTLIPDERLPPGAPAENTYYAAHQEFFEGNDSDATPKPLLFVNRRNAQTGGFPSGMLRLSECKGLPPEATCGLLAATGFNKCLAQVAEGERKLGDCFVQRTAYSGVRACDAATPCRDDYICLRPIGYDAANGHEKFLKRKAGVAGHLDPEDFGQKEPDGAWLGRNGGKGDPRGLCIPPYFVFQFRSDGHPSPD